MVTYASHRLERLVTNSKLASFTPCRDCGASRIFLSDGGVEAKEQEFATTRLNPVGLTGRTIDLLLSQAQQDRLRAVQHSELSTMVRNAPRVTPVAKAIVVLVAALSIRKLGSTSSTVTRAKSDSDCIVLRPDRYTFRWPLTSATAQHPCSSSSTTAYCRGRRV